MNIFTNLFTFFSSVLQILENAFNKRYLQIENLDDDDYELVLFNK